MASSSIHARAPKGTAKTGAIQRDPDVLAGFLEDAAHYPGGYADGLVTATSESDIASLLRGPSPVLCIGAQSSLTGGATPMGEVLLTTSRLNRIVSIGADSVRVEAGVTLTDLDAALRNAGKYYPPAPTFMGAFVGGTIATNAAGAATFKYGTTRDWVQALTVVLPDGNVLDVERGQVKADPDGHFTIATGGRTLRVPVPSYRKPQVAKLAAGYHAEPGMDLIDLFIGSEGSCALHSCRSRCGRARWRSSASCGVWRATPGAPGIRAASTSRPSSTWTRGVSSWCAKTASIGRAA